MDDRENVARAARRARTSDGGRAEETLDQPIDALGLNGRASNCLRQAQVRLVSELVERRESDLIAVPNLGRGTLEHIRVVLRQHGLVLGRASNGLALVPGRSSMHGESIGRLGFNVRASNCLRRIGVTRVGELVRLCEQDLLRVPNLGRGTLQHIGAVLAEHGLSLGAPSVAKRDEPGIESGARGSGIGEADGRRTSTTWRRGVAGIPLSERSWSVLVHRFGVGRRLTLQAVAGRDRRDEGTRSADPGERDQYSGSARAALDGGPGRGRAAHCGRGSRCGSRFSRTRG